MVAQRQLDARLLVAVSILMLAVAAATSFAQEVAEAGDARASTMHPAPPLPPLDLSTRTPIQDAIRAYDPQAALAALAAGIDPNVRDSNGDSPLHVAVTRFYDDMVLALLFMGADPMAENREGKIPADSVRIRGLTPHEWQSLERNRHHLAAFASESPPMPEVPIAQAIFFVAASRSIEPLLRWSVAAGADPDRTKTDLGETALHLTSSPQTAGWLAELGANLDVRDAYDRTPLMHAAASDRDRIVETLLAAGASVGLRDRNGNSALSAAIRRSTDGDTLSVRALIRKQAPITQRELQLAVVLRRAKTLRLLFDYGATFDPESPEGADLMLRLQRHGSDEVRAFLSEHPTTASGVAAVALANEQQRSKELARRSAFVAPYAFVFSLFLGVVPFALAIASWTWVSRPVQHALVTATLASIAIVLAYLPSDARAALASMKLIDTPMTYLPHLLAVLAVVIMACTSAMIAPAVFMGIERSGKRHRTWISATTAAMLSAGFLLILVLHNVERVSFVDEAHRRAVEILD
jgi:ankyrin repeat protein